MMRYVAEQPPVLGPSVRTPTVADRGALLPAASRAPTDTEKNELAGRFVKVCVGWVVVAVKTMSCVMAVMLYCVTPTLSVDGAQVRVKPVDVMFEATGVPGAVGGVTSVGRMMSAGWATKGDQLPAASRARRARAYAPPGVRPVNSNEVTPAATSTVRAVPPWGRSWIW